MRSYNFKFEVDNETFRNIDSIEIVVKHKTSSTIAKLPISKRSLKYKAYLEYKYRPGKPSTGE